ncbi:hypothetical protein [Lysinibacillus sp. NPDC047702]|uniref:hypothetical protein n=1 Tax=unclassified Lysinibacillus TaxID=2636778 RepID=UPI003D0354EB
MDKKQELVNAVMKHPERRLVVMYSSEGNSDYSYTLGKIERIEVTETTLYDDRIFFNDEYEDLLEILAGDIHSEKHGNRVVSDEEDAEIEKLAKQEMKNYEWEPVIAVYVGS